MMKNRSNTGQVRVVEVIIASFIIVVALSFVSFFAVNPESSNYEPAELEKLGYSVLLDLDRQLVLPSYTYGAEWSNLTAAIRVCLPVNVYFNLTVCCLNGTEVNNVRISNGENSVFASSTSIASVTYGLAGFSEKISATQYNTNYDPRILILQLVRA